MKKSIFKKGLILTLAALLASTSVFMSSCFSDDTDTNGKNGVVTKAPNNNGNGAEDNGGKALKIADNIKAAMEASYKLSGTYHALANDGSVITMTDHDDKHSPTYAAMPNVKKVCGSNVQREYVVALTDSGELYYLNEKIADNVKDIVFCTTNVGISGFCISGDTIKWVDCSFESGDVSVEDKNRSHFFKNINNSRQNASGNFISIEVDKHDYVVVNDQGDVFEYFSGHKDAFQALDYSEFNKMALVDIAKCMGKSDVKSLTVAGLKAEDGTPVATGTYAEDILSWGKLSYLTMSDGMIVGLTPDGKLKMTGDYAEYMKSFVESWSDIVAVEAGNCLGEQLITAIDSAGNFYYVSMRRYSVDSLGEPESGKISLTDGVTGGMYCCKYTPDGKVYSSRDGAWKERTVESDY